MSKVIGNLHENEALHYLSKRGLRLITRNYHKRTGEIDLIMTDQKYLIFIEVRYRQNSSFGGSLASVTYQKQQRLIRTAQLFLQQHREYHYLPCRFDLIAIDREIKWLQNAFQ